MPIFSLNLSGLQNRHWYLWRHYAVLKARSTIQIVVDHDCSDESLRFFTKTRNSRIINIWRRNSSYNIRAKILGTHMWSYDELFINWTSGHVIVESTVCTIGKSLTQLIFLFLALWQTFNERKPQMLRFPTFYDQDVRTIFDIESLLFNDL